MPQYKIKHSFEEKEFQCRKKKQIININVLNYKTTRTLINPSSTISNVYNNYNTIHNNCVINLNNEISGGSFMNIIKQYAINIPNISPIIDHVIEDNRD